MQEIESLLPVQRCHSETDFETLLTLYDGEGWNCISPEWSEMTQRYFSKYNPEQCIILGCTHYPYLETPLRKIFPTCAIIDPSRESALALERYIKKYQIDLKKDGEIVFL